MELKTKYQYTYFIYPFVVKENKYQKYLLKLLKDERFYLKEFEKQKNIKMYQYFLPKIGEILFSGFSFSEDKKTKLRDLPQETASAILAKNPCTIFEYRLKKDVQGKTDENGIFFKIGKIELICFQSGICFLLLKTNIEGSNYFADVLNFNYKFREINSISYELKEYENIKIQSNKFKDVKDISKLINEITCHENISKKVNIGNEKFFVYSYSCVDQKDWNENTDEEEINNIFEKYRSVSLANSQITNDKFTLRNNNGQMQSMYKNQYIKYGFSSTSTVLLTSNTNTCNFTVVSQKYESEYFYTYILTLYKKILLNKLNYDFGQKFKDAEKRFLEFTKKLWIQDVTNEEFGSKLELLWTQNLELEKSFDKLKNEYDVSYKKYNVEELNKNNRVTRIIIAVFFLINILTIIYAGLN